MADIGAMIGKEVEVSANGVWYTGILIEVSDEEVHLKSPLQWVTIPASRVGSIRLAATPGRKDEAGEREPEA